MMSDGVIRSAITGVARGHRTHMTLKDPGERGGGRLSLLVRATKNAPSAEFYVTWQRDGVRRSTKIGSYPTMSLAQARAAFREEYQPAVLDGSNPLGPRVWRRKGVVPTFGDMLEGYVSDLEAKGKGCAARYREVLLGHGGVAEAVGPTRPASDITADDLTPYIGAIYQRGKHHYAEFVRACLRAAFQYALKSKHDVQSLACGLDWGVRVNPVDYIKRIQLQKARERALTPMEFRALWFWLLSMTKLTRYKTGASAIMLMMATGQRPGEILALRRPQYDPVEGSLDWAKTKNGRSHSIPVCRQADAILRGLEVNEHQLFFPRQRIIDQPMLGDSAATIVEKFIRETGTEAFQMRDLRRTWKSLAGDAGISKEAADRLQNHAFRDVGSIHYDRSDHWIIKTDGVDRWSAAMDYILYSVGPVTRRALGRAQLVLQLEAHIIPNEGNHSSS